MKELRSVRQLKISSRANAGGGRRFFLRYPYKHGNYQLVYDSVREFHDIEFVDKLEQVAKVLVVALEKQEPGKGDGALLNRIIRNGGLLEYSKRIISEILPEGL